jgi:uncharacterized membrane protein YhiD involved in acid resistance
MTRLESSSQVDERQGFEPMLTMSTTELQIFGEVALAMLPGAIIGLDREVASKPAGIRTHMLVAGGWASCSSSCT